MVIIADSKSQQTVSIVTDQEFSDLPATVSMEITDLYSGNLNTVTATLARSGFSQSLTFTIDLLVEREYDLRIMNAENELIYADRLSVTNQNINSYEVTAGDGSDNVYLSDVIGSSSNRLITLRDVL